MENFDNGSNVQWWGNANTLKLQEAIFDRVWKHSRKFLIVPNIKYDSVITLVEYNWLIPIGSKSQRLKFDTGRTLLIKVEDLFAFNDITNDLAKESLVMTFSIIKGKQFYNHEEIKQ